MYVAAAHLKQAYIPPDRLLALDPSGLDESLIADCYSRLRKLYEKLAERYAANGERDYDSLAKGPNLLKALNTELRRRFTPRKKGGQA
jgi:hypothetical protein